jgi:hypothetical protein
MFSIRVAIASISAFVAGGLVADSIAQAELVNNATHIHINAILETMILS